MYIKKNAKKEVQRRNNILPKQVLNGSVNNGWQSHDSGKDKSCALSVKLR